MTSGEKTVYSHNKIANWFGELAVVMFYLFLLVISPLILLCALIKDGINNRFPKGIDKE